MESTFIKMANWLKSTEGVVYISLTAICFVSCFLLLRTFGVYGDDWYSSTFLYNNSLWSSVKYWIEWKGEINNFRPMAVFLPFLWHLGYAALGLSGVFLVIGGLYSLVACLFYKIITRFTPPLIAFAASVLLILYPTNNFYLWQATSTYPLGLMFVLVAVLFFLKNKYAMAFVFLLCGALSNEASIFVFALALIPNKKISLLEFRRNFISWLKVAGVAVVLYAVARVIAEKTGFLAVERLGFTFDTFNPVSYVLQFFKSIFVVLASSWGFAGWKILKTFQIQHLFVGLLSVAIFALVFLHFKRKNLNNLPAFAPAWYLLVAGILLICAGRYYGFYFVPSINVLNLDSRYYFSASVGGAVFFAGLIQLIWYKINAKHQKVFALAMCTVVLFLGVFKYEVQADYSESWKKGKAIWKQLFEQVPSLQPGEVVVVKFPFRPLGTLVDTGEAVGDLRFMIPSIYGPQTLGFSSNFLQEERRTGENICFDSAPYYEDYCVTIDKVYFFSWDGSKLLPSGKSAELEQRPLRRNISEHMYRELTR
jgi:hypothetical protein